MRNLDLNPLEEQWYWNSGSETEYIWVPYAKEFSDKLEINFQSQVNVIQEKMGPAGN